MGGRPWAWKQGLAKLLPPLQVNVTQGWAWWIVQTSLVGCADTGGSYISPVYPWWGVAPPSDQTMTGNRGPHRNLLSWFNKHPGLPCGIAVRLEVVWGASEVVEQKSPHKSWWIPSCWIQPLDKAANGSRHWATQSGVSPLGGSAGLGLNPPLTPLGI